MRQPTPEEVSVMITKFAIAIVAATDNADSDDAAELENDAFYGATKLGWYWEKDREMTDYLLKATPAEALIKGLELMLRHFGRNA